MRTARAEADVALTPEEALRLWTDLSRWPAFIEGFARVELSLEYTLTGYGPFGALADAIFIRRALRDSLRRTMARFEVEAEEEAGLR